MSGLGETATRWQAEVLEKFRMSADELELLRIAAEALDRGERAQAALLEHGLVYEDRFGAPRTRPEVAIVRDSALVFSRIVRQLGLAKAAEALAEAASHNPLALRSRKVDHR